MTIPPRNRTRVFSGIKPTGDMHLGNLVGAVQRWVNEQDQYDSIFSVVNLHGITVPWEPDAYRAKTRELATLLLAAGLDPERLTFFVQSQVPEHTECAWILNCIATFGELRRMTQFKDKAGGQESVSVGLFDYPVLMAADILLYDADEVPVGHDQVQHVELTRDIAIRFNHHYGETFVVPKATIPAAGARVMDLQKPDKKMSKSEDSPQGTVLVLDPPEVVLKKFKSAVTDSETEVRYDREQKPGVSNLLEIYAAMTNTTIDAAQSAFAGSQYGAFKVAVAEAVIEALRPLQERYAVLSADPAELDRSLARGVEKARAICTPVMDRVRTNAGLLRP
ncbi:MAG: tryptophan--tRNA ligase [Acidimicrobiia bacterium]